MVVGAAAAQVQRGTVTVVQRTSSDLRSNPQIHIVALDGVLARAAAHQ